jgi:hypothetical protein
MKHTFFLPIGDQNTASSRLRVYNIVPHLENAHIGIADHYEKGDTLVIQKVPAIDELRRAKKQGARVIYDIDDLYWKENHVFENYKDYLTMVKEADLVTTDTEEKKKDLEKINKTVVIPDSLDWDGTTKAEYRNGNVIGWTGYGNNAVYLNDIIPQLKDFKIRLITSIDWMNYIKGNPINLNSRPWNLETVDKYLAECDLGIYYMPDREFENVKGCHKLLKNWAIGLPTYISRIPDYVKAMKEAGVEEKYLVDDWSKLKNIGFDEKCRKYAMKFKAEEIAKQWTKVI